MTPIILIPARMASTRFPNKPMALIGGKPMIAHVIERAIKADIGPVCVAAEDAEIIEAAQFAGAQAILTGPQHQSGSDRIFEALGKIDPDGQFDTIVNVQGDLPTIDPNAIKTALEPLRENADCDIATLVAEIADPRERTDPNVVKAVVAFGQNQTISRALYFTRATAPHGDGPLYHHIGLYAYRRAALVRFVELPESQLEKRERLEQLRALEAGLRIDAALVDTVPLGVDTPADLSRAAQLLGVGT